MSEQREALAEALFDVAFPGEREKDPYWYQAYEHDWYAQADRLLDSDALARLLADAEQRGAARVTAALEAVCDEVSDATRGSLDEAQSFGGALVGAVNIYSDGFDRIRAALTPTAPQDPA